ncbi:hypothetical protein DFJ43DRAFT_1040302 [Lentinula guzmanii]|uniref:Uncharacterized protein n=1 Tax=Lentinula guzmanii TaxID=2804957 RepID=A0AA38MZZ9_9AGAR|nr:hypothetical protein DFJ43DRAFT_1040302 [Lentinula guzmanii]
MGNASRPGLPTASFVTVDSKEIDLIRKEPAFLKRVFDYLGPWALNFIQDGNSSDKRKAEENAETRDIAAKKARLVPDKLRVSFLDNDGKKSTVYALDIPKLIDEWKLPKNGDKKEGLLFSEFREAAGFLLKFEAERTIGGENSNSYRWFDNHFSFWLVHRGSEQLFEFWKDLEFDQRMERKVYPKPFVASSYKNTWSKAESNKARSLKVKEILAAATAAAMSAVSSSPSSSSHPFAQKPVKKPTKFGGISTPFQPGSKGKTLAPCCLGCGKRGHCIDEHIDSIHGKFSWITFVNNVACSPDRGNKPLCFTWNIRRECKGCDSLHTTTHSPGPVRNPPALDLLLTALIPPALPYHDFSHTLPNRPVLPNTLERLKSIYQKIVTPYNAKAFENALSKENLSDKYPILIDIPKHGAFLGDFPNIAEQ